MNFLERGEDELIRNPRGNEFHIVDRDAEKQEKYFVCLCGARVEKNCLHKQTGADGSYTRCYECRKIENARIVRARGRVDVREKEKV